jgi:predicted hydrocarbon binding protein
MEEHEIRTSGDNLIHALEFIKKKKGSDGLEGVVSETGQDIDDIYPDMMYPFRMYLDLLEIIQRRFNSSDGNVISKLGYDRAKNLSAFEYVKNKSDPISLFKLMEKNWMRFNNFGKLIVKEKSKSSLLLYLCEYPSNPLYCQRMKGFIEGMITAVCGMQNVIVEEEKCLTRNSKYCKFSASWGKPSGS